MRHLNLKAHGFRYLSLWVVVWGNLAGLIDFLFLRLQIYNIDSAWHIRIYYYVAVFSIIFCFWLLPRIPSRGNLLSSFNTQFVIRRKKF